VRSGSDTKSIAWENSDLRAPVVHVALGHSDMCWIAAAVGALEEAVAAAAKTPGQPQR
jgi:hypothetical protein